MQDFRAVVREGLARAARDPAALEPLVTKESVWDVSWPVNRLTGPAEITEAFLGPLQAALPHLQRRDLLFIGGRNIRAEKGLWCAAVCHYIGTFSAPLFGLRPSGRMAWLRSGEFYRIDGDRIAEAKIILDLPDLMRQAGHPPLPSLGTEITFPAPATQDGLLPSSGDSAASIALIERMLGDLHKYDPDTNHSPGQTGHDGAWDDDMLWYGPAGVGSNYRWEGFVNDHRAAFLRAFPDRQGGNHFCRLGDGDYAAISGWPSMTMTHAGEYLGAAPTGKALTLRVMDFYRTASGRIAENWVCLDYGDLFHQMGIDLIDRANAQ